MTAAATLPPSIRGHRQRQRTRSALLAAGQQLFAANPMESITIDDIAGAADVAKGSFYNHFEDKSALAAAVFDSIEADLQALIRAAHEGINDPATRIARALCTVVRYAVEHPNRLQALLSLSERRSSTTSPLNVGLSVDVQEGLASGRLAHFPVGIGILAVVGIVDATIRHVMSPSLELPVITIATQMAAATLRTLGVEAADAQHCAAAAAAAMLA